MSVNGVAINVGQVWRLRSGRLAKVVRYRNDAAWPWECVMDTVSEKAFPIDEAGHSFYGGHEDLVELQDVTNALSDPTVSIKVVGPMTSDDSNTKATNPKEAIGDKKTPLWLCSAIAMAHWSAAQFAGLIKYGAWNWRAAGVRSSTYISAIKRHIARWENGERCDPVDGTHHLGNIMACCAILLEAEAIGKLNDDRSPSADLQATFDEVEATIARLKKVYADKAPKHWTLNDELPS